VDWKKWAKRVFGSFLLIAGTVFLALQLLHIPAGLADFLNYPTLAQALWEITGRALVFAVSTYLVITGLRMINPAVIPPARFGWGKILFGMLMLHSQIGTHFHWNPDGPIPLMKANNAGEAAGMRFASALFNCLWIYLIYRGVRAGFRLNKGQIDEPAGGLSEDLHHV